MTINAIITIATLTFALGFVSAQAHSSDDEPKVDYFCCDETIRDGSRDRGFDCEHVQPKPTSARQPCSSAARTGLGPSRPTS